VFHGRIEERSLLGHGMMTKSFWGRNDFVMIVLEKVPHDDRISMEMIVLEVLNLDVAV